MKKEKKKQTKDEVEDNDDSDCDLLAAVYVIGSLPSFPPVERMNLYLICDGGGVGYERER